MIKASDLIEYVKIRKGFSLISMMCDEIVDSARSGYVDCEYQFDCDEDISDEIKDAIDYFTNLGYKIKLVECITDEDGMYGCFEISWND